MKPELWIVLAQDDMTHITLVGSYGVTNDPLPGLRKMLATLDPEITTSTRFFAVRVKGGETVSLHYIDALPTIHGFE